MTIQTIGYDDSTLETQASILAESLHFRLEKDAESCLFVTEEKLTLKMPHFSLMSADFSANAWSKRKAAGKKQGLIRACKPTTGLNIIDATAGWGRDAAILASFGAKVLMLERHTAMAALLQDALMHQSDLDKEALQLSLKNTSAYDYLHALQASQYPDVIYIDPMHPERNKSALVKKDLQALQQLIGEDKDALTLLDCAITRVKQRVVVKWPQKVSPLLPPDAKIEGKTIRFDIYFSKAKSAL